MAETDPPTTAEIQENLDILQENLDILWLLLGAYLVFFMQVCTWVDKGIPFPPIFLFPLQEKRLLQVPSPRINHIFLLSLLIFRRV